MGLFLKATTAAFLLIIVLNPVHLQETDDSSVTTNSPRRTIAKEWLREKVPPKVLQPMENEWPSTDDQHADQNWVESGTESWAEAGAGAEAGAESGAASGAEASGGIASGFMTITTEDEDEFNGTVEYPTQSPIFPNENGTTQTLESHDDNVWTTTQLPNQDGNMTDSDSVLSSSDQVNGTVPEEMMQNSTKGPNFSEEQTNTTLVPEINSTNTILVPEINSTNTILVPEINSTNTILVPEINSTNTTEADRGAGPSDPTETTAVTAGTISTTTHGPETPGPEVTTPTSGQTTPPETTTFAPETPERANISDKGASGETAERGVASESERRRRKGAWGAVLGTFVAVAVVGLVVYVILKKKQHKNFTHRKLEEDFPSDPVLRLDNSEPLDLNFGRAAYFNPGLQGDNIQMSPFPRH